MQNIPRHVHKKIKDAICHPEGTCAFEFHSRDLFEENTGVWVVLELAAGQHLFRLERDHNLFLHFFHSSPGTGTRVASIDLRQVPRVQKLLMAFTWTPTETKLHIGSRALGAKLVTAVGRASPKQFRVGQDGSVYQIGDEGMETGGIYVYHGGRPILEPTAIEAWKETLNAIDILATGQSSEGYMYETVVTNLSLVILITGFEAYSKKRFIELEQEGVSPNISTLIESFFSKRERDRDLAAVLSEEAKELNVSILQRIVSKGTINFQNYEKCKLGFSRAYGIKFGELGLAGNTLMELQSYLRYRHRIIHVSPLINPLNQERVPPEDPVFSTKDLARKARGQFAEFITRLHAATLALRGTGP